MRRTRRKNNRRNLVATLAVISIVALLLPERFTGKLISLVQVLIPIQDWASRGANAAGDALTLDDAPRLAPAEIAALQLENDAFRHRLTALSGRYTELAREHEALSGIRQRGLAGGRLIPARTVAADALTWRESRLINAGTLSGVQLDAPVTSHHFTVLPTAGEPVRDGLAVLAGEVLVGFVSQVGTHAARVVLLTDRQTEMSVRIAREQDGVYLPLEAEFWLVGTGGPLLAIRDVDHRYVDAGSIAVGDVVLTSAADPRLPAAMTIGTITRLHRDQDNILLYVLDVQPPLAAEDIHKVYVVDPGQIVP